MVPAEQRAAIAPKRANEPRPRPGIAEAVAARCQLIQQKAQIFGAGYVLGRDVSGADLRDAKR
jgi:hypothetical protein